MKLLEVIAGWLLGLVTVFVIMIGSLVAFGSIGRYMKTKSM
jgi:hypothetical protein